MNTTAITLLKNVINSPVAIGKLKEILGIKDWQFNEHVKRLTQEGYVQREANQIILQDNAKTTLLRNVSARWDIELLFRRSNELIFSHLTEPATVNQIVKDTGLSIATIYKAITDLQAIGVIKKDAGSSNGSSSWTADKFSINPSKEPLVFFAKILKTERDRTYEHGAEIIYKDDKRTIQKVPKDRTAQGELTAFSMFSDYGVEYRSPYDYYVKHDAPLDLEDIIIHSVLAASKDNNKMNLIMAIVFYVKNRNKVDTLILRQKALAYGVVPIWLDIEGYMRRKKLKNPELFLPWEEFLAKARLYEINFQDYSLPESTPDLFEQINKYLPRRMYIFLLGGENMRIKNLKPSTKDCDVAVETKEDFDVLSDTLVNKLGYSRIIPTEFSQEDKRLYPDEILIHPNRSRIDLFTKRIMGQVSISAKMIKMADYQEYGNLRVGILRNEHIFVLKAVAIREGDIQDMAALVESSGIQPQKFQHGPFDWDVVWEEILYQERTNHIRDSTFDIFDQITVLAEQTGIRAPFLGKLRRHVIDKMIKRLIRDGRKQLSEIVSLLTGGDISEQMIRNRVDALERSGNITKFFMRNSVFIRSSLVSLFQERDLATGLKVVKTYLAWRFPSREGSTDRPIHELSDELNVAGYKNIGAVDDDIAESLDLFYEYELEECDSKANQVDAARVCIGLANHKLAQDRASYFHIHNYERYKNRQIEM